MPDHNDSVESAIDAPLFEFKCLECRQVWTSTTPPTGSGHDVTCPWCSNNIGAWVAVKHMEPVENIGSVDEILETLLTIWNGNHKGQEPESFMQAKAALHAHYTKKLEEVLGPDEKGEQVQVPCPDGKAGCLVLHYEYRMTPEVRERNQNRAEVRRRWHE
jgi:hypothetical protein